MKKFLLFFIFVSSTVVAQSLTIDLGPSSGSSTARLIQSIFALAIISLAPSIIMMTTSFTRLIIVFSFLRSALGTNQTPPNVVLVSLSLFLSLFIMSPTIETAYTNGFVPLMEEKINESQAMEEISKPMRKFMLAQTRDNELKKFISLAKIEEIKSKDDIPMKVIIPAFMISELKKAFEIGFILFLPFLVIDLIVSSILMAMGMMMIPPVMISLPFKIIFFVLINGWSMITENLIKSFNL